LTCSCASPPRARSHVSRAWGDSHAIVACSSSR
jgi:hypothetical protein